MSGTRRPVAIAVAAVAAVVAVGLWRTRRPALVTIRSVPARVMGGVACELTIVVPAGRSAAAEEALRSAADALRDVEVQMSAHLAGSPVSRFNAAPAGEAVRLPAPLIGLLRRARRIAAESDGAFDVTCGPIIRLWRDAERTGLPPTPERIARTLRRVGIARLDIGRQDAGKQVDGLELDLGGIAKGYAVDRAVEALVLLAPSVGGIVNVGGDLRCWGRSAPGRPWRVGVRHPFAEGQCATLLLTDAAVATSGDYHRCFEVAGRRLSHIVDPRTARPVELTPSVTVVCLPAQSRAPSAADADAWATALSVLGPAGLDRLAGKDGFEAMIVTGTADRPAVHLTDGFRRLLADGTEIRLDQR